jgi:hypothetical protein
LKNTKESFGNGSFPWTIIYQQRNGTIAIANVLTSMDSDIAWETISEEYERLISIVKGNQQVFIGSDENK